MTEIKELSLFQENPQISDQKPDFRNSFKKQTRQFPCSSKHLIKGARDKERKKRNNETDVTSYHVAAMEEELTTAQKHEKK